MANGTSSEGWTVHSPEFRALFARESVLNSSWYAARLDAAQSAEVAELEAGIGALEAFLAGSPDRAGLGERPHRRGQLLKKSPEKPFLR